MASITDPSSSRVVLIGTSRYTSTELPDVPEVSATVRDLAAVFTDRQHGLVQPEHCRIVADADDDAEVGRLLHQAAKEAEDVLLVYFVGHGTCDEETFELYLGLRDTDPANPRYSALKYEDLRLTVLNSAAQVKIITLDCCFAGRALNRPLADNGALVRSQLAVKGAVVLAAAPPDRAALVKLGEEYTAFSGRLIRLLRDGVPDGPEMFTMDYIYQWMLLSARADRLPEPHGLIKQTAGLTPIARNRAHRLEPATSAVLEFAQKMRAMPFPLRHLAAATRDLSDRLHGALREPRSWAAAVHIGRETAFALLVGIGWLLAGAACSIYCALAVLWGRNRTAFAVVSSGAAVLTAVTLGPVIFASAPHAAPGGHLADPGDP